MLSSETRGTRIRVNVASTSKGIPSWEHTVEIVDAQEDPNVIIARALQFSDQIEAELQGRYAALQDRPLPGAETIKGLNGMKAKAEKP